MSDYERFYDEAVEKKEAYILAQIKREAEQRRKERAEWALIKWHNLTCACQSLKENGLVVTMSDIFKEGYDKDEYIEAFIELAHYEVSKKKREEEIKKYGYRPRAERHSLTERERELGYENISQLYN